MEQFRLPKIPMPELELPQSIQAVLQEAEESLRTVKGCFSCSRTRSRTRWRQQPN